MKFYIDEDKKMIFEIAKAERKNVKVAIKAFEAGIEHASNLSNDSKESKLAKYIATNFLDDESKKIAQYSFFRFMYQLKEELRLH